MQPLYDELTVRHESTVWRLGYLTSLTPNGWMNALDKAHVQCLCHALFHTLSINRLKINNLNKLRYRVFGHTVIKQPSLFPEYYPLDSKGNYSATSNNTKLVHWPFIGGLLGYIWYSEEVPGRPRPVPSSLYIKYNSPPINSHCTNHYIAMWWSAAVRF